MWKYLTTGLLIFLAAAAQHTNFLTISGVKPNLFLTVLIILAVFSWPLTEYMIWLLFGAVLLRFEPALAWPQAAIVITGLAVFLLPKFLPWSRYLNIVFMTVLGTAIFYLINAPIFLYQHWSIVLGEVVYNLIVVGVLTMVWPRKTKN